jgi:hypothetical protein
MKTRIRENLGVFHVEVERTHYSVLRNFWRVKSIEEKYWSPLKKCETLKDAEDYISEFYGEGRIIKVYEH